MMANWKLSNPVSLFMAEKWPPALLMLSSAAGLAFGFVSLLNNTVDGYTIFVLALLGFCLSVLFVYLMLVKHITDIKLGLLLLFVLTAMAIQLSIPEWIYGGGINAVMHRSMISSLLVLAGSTLSFQKAYFYLNNATPSGYDRSQVIVILVPVVVILFAYFAIITKIVTDGLPGFDWQIFTTQFKHMSVNATEWKEGWPVLKTEVIKQAGMANHILGTFMLIILTAAISLPVGVGSGIFLHEYAGGATASILRFFINLLRAMSVFVLGMIAYNLVFHSNNTFLADIIAGFYYDANGYKHIANGSFFTAALVLSILVIPVITRSTEEGCESLPQELREGSIAVGATDGYTLMRIILPWCLPNIVTGLLIGCAEAAGSVAVIMFMAGNGQFGVSPTSEVTSLAYLIWDIRYGSKVVRDSMSSYQFTAALLLLLITTGFTIAALTIKSRFQQRFRHG